MRCEFSPGKKKAMSHVATIALVGILSLSAPLHAQSVDGNFIFHEPPRTIPRIEFKDIDGEILTLADFRGRVVLLNLWATWCAPCRREMPTLDRLQGALGGPEFEVVALSLDKTDQKKVSDFLRDIGTSHLAYYQDRTFKAARTLRTVGLPTTLLIDRDGKEIGRLLGPAEWDSPEAFELIEKYLKPDGKASREFERLKPQSIHAVSNETTPGNLRDQLNAMHVNSFVRP